MLEICLIISLSIFIIFSIIAIINRKKQKKALAIALVGTLISAGVLVFPLFQEKDGATQIIRTIFYVFGIPDMDGEFGILENVPEQLFKFFEYLLYIYCILIPILTAGFIVSFLENMVNEIRSKVKTSKTVHIFSDINEKSITLAENIKTKDNIVIMCNGKEKEEYRDRIKAISGIVLRKNITQINFKKYIGKVEAYQIAEAEDENLNQTLALIENKNIYRENTTIYIFSMKEEAQVVLDSAEKHKVKTIIINETEQMVYKLLDEVPLYQNAENKHINVLIIGSGRIGEEFIKTINWCGQMIGYTLQINVIDKKANTIQKEFLYKYPELSTQNYDIHFYEADINTIEGKAVLTEKCMQTNYIVIAMGDENLNLNTALQLRRFFLQHNRKPIINLKIENTEKEKQISVLKNERGNNYQINPFGSIQELYGENYIFNNKLEKLAQKVHLSYSPSDKNLEEYYKIEYYKKSSKATALHLKYKMYSILGEEFADITKFEALLNDKQIKDELAKNEHERWNAYVRSDGYQLATIEKVKEYVAITNHHVYHLAKLHPALIEFEELDKLSEELTKLMNKKVDLKQSDYNIIEAIPEIIK